MTRHCPGTKLHPSDSQPPWNIGSEPRNRRIHVPIGGGKALLGTFSRNGDLAFSVTPPVAESVIAPVLAALAELEYAEVRVIGLDGFRTESSVAPDSGAG